MEVFSGDKLKLVKTCTDFRKDLVVSCKIKKCERNNTSKNMRNLEIFFLSNGVRRTRTSSSIRSAVNQQKDGQNN